VNHVVQSQVATGQMMKYVHMLAKIIRQYHFGIFWQGVLDCLAFLEAQILLFVERRCI